MTDSHGENRPAPLSGLSADLKAAAGAIGWLAGSMSGVVALMYAVGFLSAKSHLSMLGIELYSGLAAGAYVEIGAKFFYITVIMLFEGLIGLGRSVLPALAMVLIPVLVVIAGIGAVIARIRGRGTRDILRQWHAALRRWGADAMPARIILSGFLALVLLWAGSQYRNVFAPVQISGVLHMACAEAPTSTGAGAVVSLLACSIRRQDHGIPRAYYAGLVNLVFGLFLVVVPFRRRLLRQGATRIFYIPLMILFMIYSLVLPLTYGALVMPNDFPKVNIHAREDSEIRIPEGSFYLIHQGETSMILWHAGNAASYVIPSSGITTLEVIGRAPLFSGPPPSPNAKPPGGAP
jgi:hypothetical protein